MRFRSFIQRVKLKDSNFYTILFLKSVSPKSVRPQKRNV
ncbi:hypothetical protein LEP1GSC008_2195 [Leptospira kirschneri serovar Bulgarica str. Nikolaevo]|uniref:Uncharacterized protein n=1 Tax=Leptospira kirschneri serovar Bulgarica str. Nikolaevo TaxID=1240687 RepID=M6EYT3_9LEPT|nr:hypothetical protein LEP1GSC008_2195 [Leptospira kirschneri serovar Bulgarica str. Nikolaevo]